MHLYHNWTVAGMIDHSSRLTKTVVAPASAATVGCHDNCDDVTSSSPCSDAGEHDGLAVGRVQVNNFFL